MMTTPKPTNGQTSAPSTRGERTALRLRNAARDAFEELGWNATRVEDIVQRAGVSHGTFYTYYENKTAVLDHLVRSSQADFSALAAAPWQADDVRGALERVIGGFLDLFERDVVIMRTWLQAARDDRAFSALYLSSRAEFVDRVTDRLDTAVAASGREDVPPSQTVASTLVAMVEQFAYAWLVLGEPHKREDVLDALVLIWGSTLNALANFEVVRLER
jgi:AcrR family transcriptional regulator